MSEDKIKEIFREEIKALEERLILRSSDSMAAKKELANEIWKNYIEKEDGRGLLEYLRQYL